MTSFRFEFANSEHSKRRTFVELLLQKIKTGAATAIIIWMEELCHEYRIASHHSLQLFKERSTAAKNRRVAWFAPQEEEGHSEHAVSPYKLNLLHD